MTLRRVLYALLVGALAPLSAYAGNASVAPATLTATLAATVPTTFVWTVKVPNLTGSNPTGLVLTSPQATVSTPGGQVLQVLARPLSITLSASAQGSVAETFTLSPATIVEAQRLGVNALLLQRTFGVAPYGGTATVQIALGGSAGGGLALARVSLHFDDRSLVRMLRAGDTAVAIAEINYTGSGVLNGLWEIAGPPSTLGEPVFVPLAATSVNLGGGGLTEVTSPVLPATLPGSYFVRFRVRSPAVPFAGLLLQYAVAEAAAAPITVLSPRPHATLNANTRFEWRAANDAVAYRLEFYAADAAEDSAPLSGQWVPATKADAMLTVLAQTHLEPGAVYRWRIIALDADSNVVGQSAFYEINTP